MAGALVKPAQLDEALRAVEDARIAARLSAETIAAQQAHQHELEGEVARLKGENAKLLAAHPGWVRATYAADAKLATLLVAASAAYDYFSDKTDADFDGGHFIGNREAGLASELAEAIRKVKGE